MAKDIYEEMASLRAKGMRGALATIIAHKGATPRKEMAKMLIRSDGYQIGTIGGGSIEAEVFREAHGIMETGTARLLSFDLTGIDPEESALLCGGSMDVYVEPIIPDPTLIILGAGHVSKAAAEIAKLIGFRIVIVDDRPKHANADLFPMADVFHVGPMEKVLKEIPVSETSYIFIASRSRQFDLICLRFAVQSPAKYIGMLGSGAKNRALLQQIEKEGVDPKKFERVCVPVGLDIGSETPEEIAVSMAAELIASRKNLKVSQLRDAVRKSKTSSS
jgi:xanthine dehydrogenase accessory factor